MGLGQATLTAKGTQLFRGLESIWHPQVNKSLHKLITHTLTRAKPTRAGLMPNQTLNVSYFL